MVKYIFDKQVLNNELESRRKKLNSLRNKGIAFPNDFRRNITSDKLHIAYSETDPAELESMGIQVSVAGRIVMRRVMGKASFLTLQDMGGRIQLYISCDYLQKDKSNEEFKKWDLGDIIGVCGKLFKTKTGELSIRCTTLKMLTKSLRPLPNKFHGLMDREICYRQRYLDLISNDKTRYIFHLRAKLIEKIRHFMVRNDFIEVETPMMQLIPGGATSRPFVTHHNALNLKMYMRIAPELYLKRLVVGGLERIFEINRNFRNEGLSPRHNPEFTMMELYMAYADYEDLMKMIENLLSTLAQELFGTTKLSYGQYTFDFINKFDKFTINEAIIKHNPNLRLGDLEDFAKSSAIARSLGIQIESHWKLGNIITEIFEKTVQAHLIQPTFITEYPVEVSPLARRNDKNPEITDRFEFFIGGNEIANGFSELNDMEDQAQRFLTKYQQSDEQTTLSCDKDYLTALEYGLPPTAGLGIGIDRLVMIFTDSSNIRDVILFPLLRPNINDN
ncbi:lysine--tRNA ligase [Candidatus Ishikawella capsulata]|uniref:Lysine--tRNA ligase n=1 Tax=Candidatus Ishikawaella capsulata Mpkobe TaxID=476281 RepID=C5WCF3_9ENTR|nr:lysine--tRNA ligase [Candidatus Ishikawaella capsulata]BAH83009.1 lysine tRNA synthetase [Candidatus Ishikawaella capsulata Mpkobe]